MVAINNDNRGMGDRQKKLRQRLFVGAVSWFYFIFGAHVYNILIPSSPSHVAINAGIDIDVPFIRMGEPIKLVDDPLDVFLGKYNLTQDIKARQILSASTNLINIGYSSHEDEILLNDYSYGGIVAEFCPLKFDIHNDNSIGVGTYQDIIEKSHCGKGSKHIIRVDLKEVIQLVREYDAYIAQETMNTKYTTTILDLKGVVFHEGKCGASLAYNLLIESNPTKNRVYSESGPLEAAMKICPEGYTECSVKTSANLLKDVVYLMGRSNDIDKENLFFILQPEATHAMQSFRLAFPNTPWIFLFRDSMDAIMSKSKREVLSYSPMVQTLLKKMRIKSMSDLSTTELYAAQLATFRYSVLMNFDEANGFHSLGLAVEYSTRLASDLVNTIVPLHFHTVVDKDGKRRIRNGGKNYDSRDDGVSPPDAEDRESYDIPESVKRAAKKFLDKPYKKLDKSTYNFEKCQYTKGDGTKGLQCEEQEGSSDD